MAARFLATTADERSWRPGGPMVFLGTWCRRYDRRASWQALDAVVAAPYGLGEAQKDTDLKAVRALEQTLFPDFCVLLNAHHGVQHSHRYWRIVLGHWFRRCLEVVFNRTRTLEQCLARYEIDGTTILEGDGYHLAPQDSYAAIWAFNDDRWNHCLYGRILEMLPKASVTLERLDVTEGPSAFEWTTDSVPTRASLRDTVVHLLRSLERLSGMNERVHIVNSYLPRIAELRLQLLLGQWPRLPAAAMAVPRAEADRDLRAALSARFERAGDEMVEHAARRLVFEMLPVCFLEGFSALEHAAKAQPGPDAPRIILTSNNFDTDEVFKLWAAGKIANGSKYVIGQHGNNYGAHRHIAHYSMEEEIADRFLTWGWQDGLQQHTPAFLLKTAGKGAARRSNSGELLLIQMPALNRCFTWDTEYEFSTYLQDQERFVTDLRQAPQEELRIRLHGVSAHLEWSETRRWRDFNPALKIDYGSSRISNLIKNSRLVVHSYDSTGILECLAQDVPMIAFWQNGLEHVRDSARMTYRALVDAGIFHLSAASAAEKVNSVWNDVTGWWQSSEVVAARSLFCEHYAVSCRKPARRMREILDQV